MPSYATPAVLAAPSARQRSRTSGGRRWSALAGTPPSEGPSDPVRGLRQRHGTDWEEAWPNATRQEQESAVPEQKVTGWLSRLRR